MKLQTTHTNLHLNTFEVPASFKLKFDTMALMCVSKGHHVYNHRYTVVVCDMEPTSVHNNNVKNWKVYRINFVITGQVRKAPEGTWVIGGGIPTKNTKKISP